MKNENVVIDREEILKNLGIPSSKIKSFIKEEDFKIFCDKKYKDVRFYASFGDWLNPANKERVTKLLRNLLLLGDIRFNVFQNLQHIYCYLDIYEIRNIAYFFKLAKSFGAKLSISCEVDGYDPLNFDIDWNYQHFMLVNKFETSPGG